MSVEAVLFGFFGVAVALIFMAICFGLSAAFWRLVDQIFGWHKR